MGSKTLSNIIHFLFSMALSIALSSAAYAQEHKYDADGIIVETQNPLKDSFYVQCVKTTQVTAKPESIEKSCLCMSAHMQALKTKRDDAIRKQQIYSVFRPTQSVPDISQNDVLLKVYAPCLYLTVYDMVYDQCYYNKEYHRYMKSLDNLNSMCNCMATRSEEYIKDYGEPRLAVLLHQGARIEDPLVTLTEDIEYLKLSNTVREGCFRTYTQHIK